MRPCDARPRPAVTARVTNSGWSLDDDVVDARQRRLEVEGRLTAVPFGVEDVYLVHLADLEAELAGARVHVDRARERVVNAAQVQGQPAVHVQEQVVVAAEGEALAALVGEADVDLGGEILVV